LICCGKANGEIILLTVSNEGNKKKNKIIIRKTIAPSINNNELINHVEFTPNEKSLIIASNDHKIRVFNLENSNLSIESEYISFSASNHFNFSYDNTVLSSFGDYENVELFDPKNCEKIGILKGHFDYGFVVRFQHLSNTLLASGNQDQSMKLWDLRKSICSSNDRDKQDSSLKTIFGKQIEAIGNLLFTPDNKFICFGENIDYLHLYEIKTEHMQTFNFIGNLCGMTYNSLSNNIFGSISDSVNHGIMIYEPISSRIY